MATSFVVLGYDYTGIGLNELVKIKDNVPDFKIVVFTPPNRIKQEAIDAAKKHDEWLKLAPQGWHNTDGECFTWAYHEAEAKIKLAIEKGIDATIFRAPYWKINRACYEVCRDLGLVVCDCLNYFLVVPETRVFNVDDIDKIKPPVIVSAFSFNELDGTLRSGKLEFNTNEKFTFPWNVAKERETA